MTILLAIQIHKKYYHSQSSSNYSIYHSTTPSPNHNLAQPFWNGSLPEASPHHGSTRDKLDAVRPSP